MSVADDEHKAIIEKVLDGDINAFREIVRSVGPSIRVYLSSNLFEQQAVDDLLQEVFIAAYHQLDQYNPEYPLKAWIYGITRNKIKAYLRKYYRDRDKKERLEADLVEQLVSHVEARCQRQETLGLEAKLKKCLELLTPPSQQLIKARYYDKTSVIKIAKQLKKSENSVSVNLFRVRSDLRKCIEKGLKV